MHTFYTDRFHIPLPDRHPFPHDKYTRLRERVQEHLGDVVTLVEPAPVSDAELALAHSIDYVGRVATGRLTAMETRRLGFPWSPELVERSRRSCGATIEAARAALRDGVAVSLAGGTHHAFRDRGGGYCVFNDSAVTAALLRAERTLERVLVVDCDVHQGDGTAAMMRSLREVFTFSIHGARNYPRVKEESDLDVALDDDTADDAYLDALDRALDVAFDAARPELVLYLAGADPLAGDRFGRLALTKDGLRERDRRVLERCRAAGAPVAVTMAGGYARNIDDSVDVHLATVEEAARAFAVLAAERADLPRR